MLQRTSFVDYIKNTNLAFSSLIQLGDSNSIYNFSRALAVQREVEFFHEDEGHFGSYSTFTKPISFAPITENIQMVRHNLKPLIKVGKIDILGISSSSALHVGNTCHLINESRVKHIRHLQPREDQQGSSEAGRP